MTVVGIVVIIIGHRSARAYISIPSATTLFSRASASSLSTSKQDEGRRAEGLEEALQYDARLCVGICRLLER